MMRPLRTQDDDRNDVEKLRDDDDGDDDNDHRGAVEKNTGESNGVDKIEGDDIKETYEI